MTVKRKIAVALICAAGMLLGGCEMLEEQLSTWTPQEAEAISVAADGSVTEIIQETLDQSYYSMTELEAMISEEITSYNTANGEDSVKLLSLKSEDSEVTLKLWYATAEDYAQFNNVEFYCGTIIGAQLEGYSFDLSFYQVEDGEIVGEVDYSRVFEDMSAQLIIVQASKEVHVEGKVTFLTTNADLFSADTVDANGEREEAQTLELPSSAVYGQTEEATGYAEQKVANRVYILCEQ